MRKHKLVTIASVCLLLPLSALAATHKLNGARFHGGVVHQARGNLTERGQAFTNARFTWYEVGL